MRFIYLLIITISLFSCKNNTNNSAETLLRIQVPDELSQETPKLSTFFKKITYIPLETTKQSLIERFPQIAIIDSCLLIHSNTGIMLFEKETGKFIRKIGTEGKAPGEYYKITEVYNKEKKTVYAFDHYMNLMEFDFEGNFRHSIPTPLTYSDENFENTSRVENICPINDTLYCGYFPNRYGLEKKKILIFDHNGKVINLFPNHQIIRGYNIENMGYVAGGIGPFYQYDQNTYFKETYSDTIFQVTPEKLLPHTILNFGKNQREYAWQYEFGKLFLEGMKKRNFIENPHAIVQFINETGNKLYFWFSLKIQNYLGVYNKTNKEVKTFHTQKGFEDDINHFVNINVKSFLPNGQAIGIIQPMDIVEWFENNNSQELPKEIQELKNTDLESNPIVVILE